MKKINVTHKLNHYIPCSILKYWVTEGKNVGYNYDGVYCYLIQEDRIIYADKAFTFAIAKDLYVPIINGIRNIYVEGQWLSKIESAFKMFSKQLLLDNPNIDIENIDNLNKILMCFYAYKFRTKHELDQIIAHLKENPNTLRSISQSEDIKVGAIENIVNATREMYLRNRKCRLEITKYNSKEVIFGDNPFIELNNIGLSLLPVNPSTIIGFKKRTDESPHRFEYGGAVHGEPPFLHSINRIIAEKAYYWIIANDLETLEKNIPFCNKKSEERRTVNFEPFREQMFGWSFS
jgi:hypothetical protein